MALGIVSCVNIDERLGGDLVATNQKYDIYTAEIPLEEIQMRTVDSLVAFSSKSLRPPVRGRHLPGTEGSGRTAGS